MFLVSCMLEKIKKVVGAFDIVGERIRVHVQRLQDSVVSFILHAAHASQKISFIIELVYFM